MWKEKSESMKRNGKGMVGKAGGKEIYTKVEEKESRRSERTQACDRQTREQKEGEVMGSKGNVQPNKKRAAGPDEELRQREKAVASPDTSLSGSQTQISLLIAGKPSAIKAETSSRLIIQVSPLQPLPQPHSNCKLHLKGTWIGSAPFTTTLTANLNTHHEISTLWCLSECRQSCKEAVGTMFSFASGDREEQKSLLHM